ncbi:MAG: hypothetical protein ABIS07_03280, partial [Dokdonella sp.]
MSIASLPSIQPTFANRLCGWRGSSLRSWVMVVLVCCATHSLSGIADETTGARAFDAVDPFIGTGGEGHTFPGAVVPFGMIQLSPDTQLKSRKEGYGWAAGYRHEDTTIFGFSHTHFSGTG